MVTTAIVLPLVVLLATLVIDVGNWFEHRRHLQMQADAAVLAAAADVTYPCDDATIKARAAQYGGLASLDGAGPYNVQIGDTPAANVSSVFNSPTWSGQAAPVDPDVRTGEPCSASMIDVKLTETRSAVLLPARVGRPHQRARARRDQPRDPARELPPGVGDRPALGARRGHVHQREPAARAARGARPPGARQAGRQRLRARRSSARENDLPITLLRGRRPCHGARRDQHEQLHDLRGRGRALLRRRPVRARLPGSPRRDGRRCPAGARRPADRRHVRRRGVHDDRDAVGKRLHGHRAGRRRLGRGRPGRDLRRHGDRADRGRDRRAADAVGRPVDRDAVACRPARARAA